MTCPLVLRLLEVRLLYSKAGQGNAKHGLGAPDGYLFSAAMEFSSEIFRLMGENGITVPQAHRQFNNCCSHA